MKSWLSIVLVILIHQLALAQRPIEIIIDLEAPYSRNIEDYTLASDRLSVSVVNHTATNQNVYFLSELNQLDGDIRVAMKPEVRPSEPFVLEPGMLIPIDPFDVEDKYGALDRNDVDIQGINITEYSLSSNRQIPEGTYEICIVAFDFATDVQLSIGCSFTFTLGYDGVIEIIQPAFDEEVVAMEEFPITWDVQMSPEIVMGLDYELKLIDLTQYNETFGSPIEVFNEGAVEVAFETEVQMNTTYFYNGDGSDPELVPGHLYGIRVQAVDEFDEVEFSNEGYSEIRTFYYMRGPDDEDGDEDEFEAPVLPEDCASRCEIPAFKNNTPSEIGDRQQISIGYFVISDLDLLPSGNSYNGTGTIEVEFLNNIKIPVDLQNITINSEGRVLGGWAKAQVDAIPELEDAFNALNLGELEVLEDYAESAVSKQMTDEQALSIGQGIRNTRMLANFAAGGEVKMPVGIDQRINGQDLLLGITAMTFTPESARCRVMAGFPMPIFNREDWLLLEGAGVCLHPKGFGGDYTFGLGADFRVGDAVEDTYAVVFGGGSSEGGSVENASTYFKMTCAGLEEMNIGGYVEFNRDHILPDEDGQIVAEGQARGGFVLNLKKSESDQSYSGQAEGNNILLGLNMTPFQFKGLKGWTFEANNAFLDFSELEDASGMQFPSGYNQEMDGSYKGIYIKNMSITPPGKFGNSRQDISVQNLLFEPNIYFNVTAEDIIEQGSLEGWSFSLDSFYLEVFNNNLVAGGFGGGIGTPLFAPEDKLEYSALLDFEGEEENDYVFNVDVGDGISMPLFIAEANLADNSHITVASKRGEEGFVLDAGLHGDMTISTVNIANRDQAEPPAVTIDFADVEFHLNYDSEQGFDEDETEVIFAQASPQKTLSGFPVSLNNFGINFIGEGLQLNMDLHFDLVGQENGIAATTTLGINSTLEIEENLGASLKTFRFTGLEIQKVEIDSDFSAFHLNGSLDFYRNEVGGSLDKGLRGELAVDFPIPLSIGLEAQFGSVRPERGRASSVGPNNYRYFQIAGSLAMGSSFPTLGPLSIYGFKGGLYHNMSMRIDGEGERLFTPEYQVAGFSAGLITALATTPQAFNADANLGMEFSRHGGVRAIRFEGKGYLMSKFPNRAEEPPVMLRLGLDIARSPFSINGNFGLFVNLGNDLVNLKGGKGKNGKVVDGNLFIGDRKWYFHMGDPFGERGRLKASLGDLFNFNMETYLMVGHELPTSLPPIPGWIEDIIGGSNASDVTPNNGIESTSQRMDRTASRDGKGFVHGSYINSKIDFNAFILKAYLRAGLGYDINLVHQPGTRCGGNPIGINGWYAQAQAYAGIEGRLTVGFTFLGNRVEANIGHLALGLALEARLPNPAFFQGRAGVRFNALGGLIKGNAQVSVSLGKRCEEMGDSELGVPVVDVSYPEAGGMMEVYRNPVIKFNFDINKKFELPKGKKSVREYKIVLRPGDIIVRKGNETINCSRDWSKDKRTLSLNLERGGFWDARENYSIELNYDIIEYKKNGDPKRTTEEHETIRFKTKKKPETIEPFIAFSQPGRGQRYHCYDDEAYLAVFRGFAEALGQEYFYEEDEDYQYTYYLRVVDLEDESVDTLDFNYDVAMGGLELGFLDGQYNKFTFPTLNLSAESTYKLEIIRKRQGGLLTFDPSFLIGVLSAMRDTFAQNGAVERTTTEVKKSELSELVEAKGFYDFKLYETFFRTGKYATTLDKIRDIRQVHYSSPSTHIHEDEILYEFEIDEPFDIRWFRKSSKLGQAEQAGLNGQTNSLLMPMAYIYSCASVCNSDYDRNNLLIKDNLSDIAFCLGSSYLDQLDIKWDKPFPYFGHARLLTGVMPSPMTMDGAISSAIRRRRHIPSTEPVVYQLKNTIYKKMETDRMVMMDAVRNRISEWRPLRHLNSMVRHEIERLEGTVLPALSNADFSFNGGSASSMTLILGFLKSPIGAEDEDVFKGYEGFDSVRNRLTAGKKQFRLERSSITESTRYSNSNLVGLGRLFP